MAEDQDGGDPQAQSPPADPSAVSPSSAPPAPPSPQKGVGTLAPQGAAASQDVSALGMQAMARGLVRNFANLLHEKVSPVFHYSTKEGKGVQMMLKGATMVIGDEDSQGNDKRSAISHLMQREMQARAGGGAGGPAQPGMPQPNRGPIPTMAGTQ